MKKYTIFIVACLILVMFTACGKSQNSQVVSRETEIPNSPETMKETDIVETTEPKKAEVKSEVGIFENYVEDGLKENLSDLGMDGYSQYACSLKKAKKKITKFYGIWTLGFDNATWWDYRCDFTDKTINNIEYRVDTMYYCAEDGIEKYIIGFHFIEDEEQLYIAEMDIVLPTETEEGYKQLFDLVVTTSFDEINPKYNYCNFDYGYKFPDEEEFNLAKEADEATAEDIQNQQNDSFSNQDNNTQSSSWKNDEANLYASADEEIQSYLRELSGDSNLRTQNRSSQNIQWMGQESDFSGTYDILCVTISYSSIYSNGSYFEGTYHAIIHYTNSFMYHVDSVY